jgi:hypothetical protein
MGLSRRNFNAPLEQDYFRWRGRPRRSACRKQACRSRHGAQPPAERISPHLQPTHIRRRVFGRQPTGHVVLCSGSELADRLVESSFGGRPGTRTRMSYLTRPSNVRVYQFRQPPGSSRLILPNSNHAGTRGKTRTRNLLIRSQTLYPLSYAGAEPWYGTRRWQVILRRSI